MEVEPKVQKATLYKQELNSPKQVLINGRGTHGPGVALHKQELNSLEEVLINGKAAQDPGSGLWK